MNIKKHFSFALATLPLVSVMAQDERPNIILIMTDQQSFDAISAHSDLYPESYFSTPNIDRLAKDGISFTRAYCSNPVSVPSRFALFTGHYGGQFNIRDNQTPDADENQTRALLSVSGMGNVFEKGGYDTYYGGKVHLPFSDVQGKSKFAAPRGYGFVNCFTNDEREILGLETAKILDEKGESIRKGNKEKPFLLVSSFLNPHDICLESSTNLSPIVEDKGGKKQAITDCVRQMRNRAAAIDSTDFYANHAPMLPSNFATTENFPTLRKSPTRNFPEYYWRKYRWTYGQLVSLVDDHIGAILDALDRNQELKKNTIVVFTSDHGEMQGAHQTVTKNLPYEECQRIPFIFSGPGIAKNARDNALTCNGVDLLPTICDLAGIDLPQTDGLSLLPRLQGNNKDVFRKELYLEGDGFFTVISENDKYTLFDGKNNGEMYIDFTNDKGELNNVFSDNSARANILKKNIPAEIINNNAKGKKEKNNSEDKKIKKQKKNL